MTSRIHVPPASTTQPGAQAKANLQRQNPPTAAQHPPRAPWMCPGHQHRQLGKLLGKEATAALQLPGRRLSCSISTPEQDEAVQLQLILPMVPDGTTALREPLQGSRLGMSFQKAAVHHPNHLMGPARARVCAAPSHQAGDRPPAPSSPQQAPSHPQPQVEKAPRTTAPLASKGQAGMWGCRDPSSRAGTAETERTRRQHTRKGRFLLGFSWYESSCTDQHTEAA